MNMHTSYVSLANLNHDMSLCALLRVSQRAGLGLTKRRWRNRHSSEFAVSADGVFDSKRGFVTEPHRGCDLITACFTQVILGKPSGTHLDVCSAQRR